MCLRKFFVGLFFAAFFTILFTAIAFAAVPNTSISPSPARPDGYFGWYRTVPTITLTSDQPGTTYYQWDSISGSWTTYTASFPALTGDYDLNIYHTLYYYSVSGADTEQVKFYRFKVDPTLPTRIVGGTCEGCHGAGAYKDQVSFLNGTSHDLPTDPVKAPDRCQRCHKGAMEGTPPFLREDEGSSTGMGIYDPYDPPGGILHEVTGNDNSVCFACHESGILNSAYPGKNLFVQTKHFIVGSSGKALPRWPDKNYDFGMCGNCHDPHGVEDPGNPGTGISDYRNVARNNLCFECHDDSAAPPKPAGYFYRGSASYNASEHSSSSNAYTKWPNPLDTGGGVPIGGTGAQSGECINCHNTHGKDDGGGLPISNLTMATEENLCVAGGGGACHSAATGSQNGINILERLSYYPLASIAQSPPPIYTGSYTAHHDITDSDQMAAGSKLECKNCHNPHLDNRPNKMVNPDDTTASYTATTPDPFGYSSVVIKGTAVTEDTKIKQNSSVVQENSPDTYLWAGKDFYAKVWRTLVKFNLSSIPPGATISQATLILQVGLKYNQQMNINIHRLTESWTESGATWFMRDGVNNWSTAGGSFDPTPSSTKNSVLSNMYYGAENFDVTSLVSGWYNTTYSNNGMLLRSGAEGTISYRAYYQSEATGSNQKFIPTLVVRYYTTPPSSVLNMAGFCEKCHDGTPPGGVVTPLNLKTITQVYFDPLYGEFHGARVGEETYYTGTEASALKPPYYAGMPPLPCTDCHDTHGTSNLYHLKENINGQAVTVTNTTPQAIRSLCQACHQISPGQHGFSDVQTCFNCHYHRGGLSANLNARDAF